MHTDRAVRNDATCSIHGRVYEVPQHLRGRKATLHYEVLRPEIVWLEEGGVRVPIREVEPVANSRRTRVIKPAPQPKPPKHTGRNNVEGTLNRLLHPSVNEKQGEAEGGATCAR